MTRVTCWLKGHSYLRLYEPNRIALRCERCGATTPGLRDDELPKPRVIYGAPIKRKFRVVKAKKARTA